MHDQIDNFLAQRPLMILDGALATELECRGADLRDPLWSAKCLIGRPDLIREVHLADFHRPRLCALANTGADLLASEGEDIGGGCRTAPRDIRGVNQCTQSAQAG